MTASARTVVTDLDAGTLEALIEVMYLAAFADGEFNEAEKEHFRETVDSLTEGRVSGARFHELVARFRRELDLSDRSVRLEAVKKKLTTEPVRRAAFKEAIRMAAADHIIRTSERDLFLELADVLGIERADAADMVKQYEPR